MSFRPVEYFIRQVLQDGIQRLRSHPDTLDEVFEELTRPPLATTFGFKLVKDIKDFFTENDIPVRGAFSQNQIDLPSVTVHLISSQEDPQYRSMQDQMNYERVPKEPCVIQGPFYAMSYDPDTGRLWLPKTMDLSQFVSGRKLFSAEDDVVYTVKGTIVANDPGTPSYDLKDQYVTLVDPQGEIPEKVQFAKMSLLSSIDFYLKRWAGSWLREVFEIRMNAATNSDQAIWLYYITLYILFRNKGYFEQVGLESQTFSAGEFSRDLQKMPNNIWGRTIRMTFLVQHTWSEEVNALELYDVDLNVQSNVTEYITMLE